MTDWAQKASARYDADYARTYRAHDETFGESGPYHELVQWLQRVCRLFEPPIDVLDLGCGTGRYFWALVGVRELVGLDASAAMLAEARRPHRVDRISAEFVLVEGDLFRHEFTYGRFDLIYSIGVLAEHVPLAEDVVSRVARWLKPHGRFAFTTVHPDSASVPRTLRRRLGHLIEPVAPGALGILIRAKLLADGLYADEARLHTLLDSAFHIESLVRIRSEAHLHCACVARRRT